MEEKIIDKIKKLVKKQESAEELGSVAEAEAFAAKIQVMLNKYNVSMSKIKTEEEIKEDVSDEVMKAKIPSIGGKSNFQIMFAIARNNWCKAYMYGGATNMIIIGSRENIEVVKYIASVVTPIFVRIGKEKYHEEYVVDASQFGTPVGLDTYLRRFIMGCADGLDEKLEKEKGDFVKENDTSEAVAQNGISCTALIRTNEIAIVSYADNKFGKSKRARKTTTSHSGGAYSEGVETGKNVNINKGVSTSKPINRKMLS